MSDDSAVLQQGEILDDVETAVVALDRVTRERLAVAAIAADTLERLTESGAFASLDATVSIHLVGHARGLVAWLCELRGQPAVHSQEDCALAVRRLERRLGVVLELLQEAEEAEAERAAAPFAGDFVGDETDPARRGPGAKGRPAPRPSARQRALARQAASARRLRFVSLAAAGALVAAVAVAWNGLSAASAPVPRKVAAPGGMEPAAFLEDMRLFMPVTATMLGQDTLSVMVEKAWLVEPASKRQSDALSAHTYLLNRNVPRLILRWSDGTMIASFDRERMSWHESQGDGGMQPPVPIDWH